MIKEIVDTYLLSRGLKRAGGADNDASPILPLITMDLAYSLYKEYISGMECRHELKKLKKEWIKTYTEFNKEYFRAFNGEQRDFVIEMMDNFSEHIHNDLTIVFVQFTNFFSEESLDRQKILAAAMMMDVLAQSSEIVWERVFRYGGEKDKINHSLILCSKIIHKWTNLYYGPESPNKNPNEDKSLLDSVDVLCKKQISFLKKYKNGN